MSQNTDTVERPVETETENKQSKKKETGIDSLAKRMHDLVKSRIDAVLEVHEQAKTEPREQHWRKAEEFLHGLRIIPQAKLSDEQYMAMRLGSWDEIDSLMGW